MPDNNVYANGRSIINAGDGLKHLAAPPDVCKTPTPSGPMPTPYVNVAQSKDLANGTRRVTIGGKFVALESSKIRTSSGNEPGTAGGGLVSSKTKGAMSWTGASPNVRFEGKCVVRFADSVAHNGNTYNTAFIAAGGTGWAYGDDFPCVICNGEEEAHVLPESREISQRAQNFVGVFQRIFHRQIPQITRVIALAKRRRQLNSEWAELSFRTANTLRGLRKGSPAWLQLKQQRNGARSAMEARREALDAEMLALNEAIAAENVLGFDERSCTYTRGTMIGLLICQCGSEYVGYSSTTGLNGVERAAAEAGATICGSGPSYTLQSSRGPMCSEAAAEVAALRQAVNEGGRRWTCAGPRCIDACNADGHKPRAMSEKWLDPFSGNVLHISYYHIADGVRELATARVGSGDSAPSCYRCQFLLPAMLCGAYDSNCPQ